MNTLSSHSVKEADEKNEILTKQQRQGGHGLKHSRERTINKGPVTPIRATRAIT